ncbi:BatA domain-containing protein [Sulfidibacter corallicola]|uniref:BatA domain-containing protein n=1 Tax=Sulfidibacter corallicola TaxID=2818388 RepID=A0A8A4TTY5_SULCO|nr:BatA domain-containing protein [Sulfidibacter corallicola]QTD52561.1 BatA domain-containing protein [Sulfidibacter corallicola]
MSGPLLAFAAIALVMIVVHMTRPPHERREISSARFFDRLPPAREKRSRMKWSKPTDSPPFFLRMAILALLVSALLATGWRAPTPDEASAARVWVLIDTSSGMTTNTGSGSLWNLAHQRLVELANLIDSGDSNQEWSGRLSSFDMERRDHLADGSIDDILNAVDTLKPRALGTALDLVQATHREARRLMDRNPTEGFSHMLVLSDQPAPDWVAEAEAPVVVWLDVSVPVPNAGIHRIDTRRDALSGEIGSISVELRAQGPSVPSTLVVEGNRGSSRHDLTFAQGVARHRIDRPGAGRYRLTLEPNDAYLQDNRAEIEISPNRIPRLDWRLKDRTWAAILGAPATTPTDRNQRPPTDMVVQAVTATSDAEIDPNTPRLMIGNGYKKGNSLVYDFREDHPLLANLNLDAAETMAVVPTPLPDGFTPVLRDTDGNTWLAWRASPPAAFVAGLPQGQDTLRRFSTTAFFNAVHQLMGHRADVPLYTLTSPRHPEPEGTRLALHPGEGESYVPPHSIGHLEDLLRGTSRGETRAIWPWLLAAASLLFFLERVLLLIGGPAWR